MQQAGITNIFAIVLTIVTVPLEFNPLLQAYKAAKRQSVADVSRGTYAIIFSLGSMWLIYGVMIGSIPLIAGNIAKLVSSLAVLVIVWRYRTM